MENSLELSIIVATRNSEAFLANALDSIIVQNLDFLRYEIVIVDDKSSDNTVGIISEYSERLPIKFIQLPEHLGSASARNLGIKSSNSELVLILDSDDELLVGSVNLLFRKLITFPELSLVFGQKLKFGDWGNAILPSPKAMNSIKIKNHISKGKNVINHSGCMYRRSWFDKVGGYESSFERAADLNLWYRGLGLGSYSMLSIPVVKYRTVSKFPTYEYWFRDEYFRRQYKKEKAIRPEEINFWRKFQKFRYEFKFKLVRLHWLTVQYFQLLKKNFL